VDVGETDPTDLWFRGAASRATKCSGDVLDLGEKLWGFLEGLQGKLQRIWTIEVVNYKNTREPLYIHPPSNV
jgi:hypothetical protein